VEKIQVTLKSDKNYGYLKTDIYFLYRPEFFLEWNMLQTNVVEKTNTFYVQ